MSKSKIPTSIIVGITVSLLTFVILFFKPFEKREKVVKIEHITVKPEIKLDTIYPNIVLEGVSRTQFPDSVYLANPNIQFHFPEKTTQEKFFDIAVPISLIIFSLVTFFSLFLELKDRRKAKNKIKEQETQNLDGYMLQETLEFFNRIDFKKNKFIKSDLYEIHEFIDLLQSFEKDATSNLKDLLKQIIIQLKSLIDSQNNILNNKKSEKIISNSRYSLSEVVKNIEALKATVVVKLRTLKIKEIIKNRPS
ncbi:MAG: hypothetical protein WD048_05565 [Chitinophagales bacterium]